LVIDGCSGFAVDLAGLGNNIGFDEFAVDPDGCCVFAVDLDGLGCIIGFDEFDLDGIGLPVGRQVLKKKWREN